MFLSWTLREVIYPLLKIILLKPTRSYTYSENMLKCIFWKLQKRCCKSDSSTKNENLPPIPPRNNFQNDRTSSFNSRIRLCLGIRQSFSLLKYKPLPANSTRFTLQHTPNIFNFLCLYKNNWSKPLQSFLRTFLRWWLWSCHHIFVYGLKEKRRLKTFCQFIANGTNSYRPPDTTYFTSDIMTSFLVFKLRSWFSTKYLHQKDPVALWRVSLSKAT